MIPCLNEEETLPLVLNSIPKKIKGIDDIEILLIDDGSTDNTVEIAKSMGVKHFLYHRRNQGLSRSFRHGLNRCLEMGADIIVLTEGDNQYKQEKIPELIQPVLDGKADVVISDRQTQTIDHFSRSKKIFQKLGTWVLNTAAGSNVPDAISGFRAYSRQAAMQLNPIADYSWATETTLQAAAKKQSIVVIPIKTNPKLRESRQFKSPWQHIRRSSVTIVRAYLMYKPYAVFFTFGVIFLIAGGVPFVRYLVYLSIAKKPGAHLQSLILGTVFLVASFLSFALGVLADLIRVNRILSEDALELIKKHAFAKKN
ncbi:MAG: glycosyltransferase family 2 protein [Candidatus Saccharimonadales bacterium]